MSDSVPNTEGLSFRTPVFLWLCLGVFLSLCAQGVAYIILSLIGRGLLPDVPSETIITLGYMTCTLCLWQLQPPMTRMMAQLNALVCVAFIAGLGSLYALVNSFNLHLQPNIVIFFIKIVLGLIGQLLLVTPAAYVLQKLILTSPTVPPSPSE